MTEKTTKENTPEEIRRGKAVGLWIRTGLARKSMKLSELARAINRHRSYMSVLANKDGIGARGRYNRPSEEILDKIAAVLEIDGNEGRTAAGYSEVTPAAPRLYEYTIGQLAGEPVGLVVLTQLTDEELEQIRFAVKLTLRNRSKVSQD